MVTPDGFPSGIRAWLFPLTDLVAINPHGAVVMAVVGDVDEMCIDFRRVECTPTPFHGDAGRHRQRIAPGFGFWIKGAHARLPCEATGIGMLEMNHPVIGRVVMHACHVAVEHAFAWDGS